MDGEDRARRCDGNRAGAQVRRAHRFRARTRGLKPTGEAERITASYLDPHSGDGWFVLHDVAGPQGTGNIDHVVVTPAGVFLVASVEWSEEGNDAGGALRVGRHLQRQELDTLRMAVRAVGELLGSLFPDLAIDPSGVMSLTGCPSAEEPCRVGGITAVPAARLVRHLSTGPHVYDPEQVEQLALALDRELVPCWGGSSSLVRPGPLTWPGPPGSTSDGARRVSSGPDARPARSGRPSEFFGGEGWRAGGSSVRNVIRPLVAVLGVALFFYFFAEWSRALPRVTTGAPAAPSAWVPSTAASASLRSSWSCPTGRRGWTVTLAWPAEARSQGWMAEVSSSPYGPWTVKDRAADARPPTLTGMQPGSTEWVRVGTSSRLMISNPIMAGQLVAPAGC